MNPGDYFPDGATRILRLLKETFGDHFKAYFNGDAEPGENDLPCIMVSSQSAAIESGATGTDDIQESVMIIVSYNRKDDLGAGEDDQLTEDKVRKDVMGQNPTDGSWQTGTVMYALRKHYTLNEGLVIDNKVTIDFAPNRRNQNIETQEAYVTIEIARLALVPSRD